MRALARSGGARFTGDGRDDEDRHVSVTMADLDPSALVAGPDSLDRPGRHPIPEPPGGGTEPLELSTEAPDDPPADSSWVLVQAAQRGDAEAFGGLYDKYVDVVYRYVLHRLGDRAVAEDLTSETFLRALRRIGSISYQGRDVGAWFITIARNLVLDHLKSSRFRLEISTAEPTEVPGLQSGPEATVLARAASAELLRAIASLGADQRECVVLRFLHGLSVAETAAAMDRGEGAIKALQHRAVRRLAQLLPAEYHPVG
ncbi:MAG TPA: sigma-70 family RNA polymerase sigma factor [Pseudonocardiaceae bacterium]